MNDRIICLCRDAKAQRWVVTAPAGKVCEGMYVQLVGGTFLRVEQVASMSDFPKAAAVLESVWVDGNDGTLA